MKSSFEKALRNISRHGDTDIFPFPFENLILKDKTSDITKLLSEIHSDLEKFLKTYPPNSIEALTQVGYTGFRWASQIDPFWNSYYLSLVIELAERIEAARIPATENTIFSYRYSWNDGDSTLFQKGSWLEFKRSALERSKSCKFVVVTDIADFYPRIYHHRLENALFRLPSPGDLPSRIMQLLSAFSKNVSYGLPIGGPASRLLAELALVGPDTHLKRNKIQFSRYADDYCIFCNTRAEAYRHLVFLSEKLFNEGLVLQKTKTKIYTAEEFREISKLLDPQGPQEAAASDEQRLLNVSIRFDPYSPTAEEDYESLKKAISNVDVIGILAREINKTEVDQTVTKQAINSLRVLEPVQLDGAMKTLLEPTNLEVLSPVFVTLMRTLRALYPGLADPTKDFVDKSLIDAFTRRDSILEVEVNLAYFVQALSYRKSAIKEEILIEIYQESTSSLIRRQIILIMADWGCHYWISDLKGNFQSLPPWERRALIVSSYSLGDEGKHWRDFWKSNWNPFELICRDWFADRWQQNKDFPT